MRICIDVSPLRFPHTGIAVYTLQLIRSLLQQALADELLIGFTGLGFRPLTPLFTRETATSNDERGGAAGTPGWRRALICPPPLLRDGTRRRKLLRFVKERAFELGTRRFDLFHATVTFPPGRAEKPLIPLVYDLSLLRHPETHPVERVKAFKRWLPSIQKAPIINTISQFSQTEIASLLGIPMQRIVVTRPGVDPLFLSADVSPADGDAAERFGVRPGAYFLAVGSLEPRKNLAVAMEAFAALPPSTLGTVKLLIVGPRGWGDVRVPPAAQRLHDSGRICFTGYIDRFTLRSLYRGAALFVYPSIYEGFGIPAAEALACGTPVAVSRGSSLEEVVGPYGRLLAAHDVDAWSAAMQGALDAFREEEPSARTARRQWAAQFDWAVTAAQTLAMYRTIPPAQINGFRHDQRAS